MLKKIPVTYRVFLLIISISTLTLVINTIILLKYYENNIINDVISNEKLNLERVAYSIELMIEESNNLSKHIESDSNIKTVLYNSNISYLDEANGIKSLSNFQNLPDQIHSIYLYNQKIDRFYYTGANLKTEHIFSSDNFFDLNYFRESIEYNRVNTSKPHRRVLYEYNYLTDKYESIEVYSFLYSYNPHFEYNKASIIVINISLEWLKETISFLDNSPGFELYAMDEDRNTIIGNKERYLQTLNRDNSENLIISLESPYINNWFFNKIIDKESLFYKTAVVRRTIILVASIIFIIMILISWLSSIRLGRPINELINRAEQQGYRDETDNKTLAIAKMRTLIDFYDDFSKDKIEEMLKSCHINFTISKPFNYFIIISNELSNHLSLDIIQRYFWNKLNSVNFQILHSDQLLVLTQDNLDIQSYYSDLLEQFETKSTIIYSSKSIPLDTIADKINQSNALTPYINLFPYSEIVTVDLILKQHKTEGSYPIKDEEVLISSLHNKSLDDILINLSNFIDQIKIYNIKFFHRSLNRLLRTIYEELRKINPLITRQLKLNNLESLLQTLSHFDTVDEKQYYIEEFLQNAYDLLQNGEHIDDNNQINRIISFIISNYDNNTLGAQSIGDYMKLNPTYLQSIFKKHTKISLHEYINDYRLKKSIELLESTTLSIKHILPQTGFTNEQSFFRLFKKKYNCTPKQYRNRINN